MKRTVYQIQCATADSLTTIKRYAWNSARSSILATLRQTGKSWLKVESKYLSDAGKHYHCSEVWQCEEDGAKIRFVINKLDSNGNPFTPS